MCRAAASMSATASSAAETMLEVGALTTMTPAWVAARTSTLSSPTPARATTCSRGAAASASASTRVAERTRSASASASAGRSTDRSAPSQVRTSKSGPSADTVAGLSSSAMSTTGLVTAAGPRRSSVAVGTPRPPVCGGCRAVLHDAVPGAHSTPPRAARRRFDRRLGGARAAQFGGAADTASLGSWPSHPRTPRGRVAPLRSCPAAGPRRGTRRSSPRSRRALPHLPELPVRPVVSLSSVGFSWPDGTPVLHDLHLLVPAGRSGLVGVNGAGKSTLLRLVAGELAPAAGHVSVVGEVGYLPQDLTLDVDQRVEDFLGIGLVRRAVRAVEAGDVDASHFPTIGDDWGVEDRARAARARLGLPADVLDRRLGQVSGGEVTQLGLARLLLRRPDVLLLDEPTNNLDAAARARLYDVVESWSRSLLVVSHD